ncbi:hypothetical protein D3C73_773700 [compost metagenome]
MPTSQHLQRLQALGLGSGRTGDSLRQVSHRSADRRIGLLQLRLDLLDTLGVGFGGRGVGAKLLFSQRQAKAMGIEFRLPCLVGQGGIGRIQGLADLCHPGTELVHF